MNNMKGTIGLIGLVGIIALLVAPFVMANLNRINPPLSVVVQDNNTSYNAKEFAVDANHTLTCFESDGGFNPLLQSDMNVTFSDRNGTFYYSDYCLDSNTLVEFACGANLQQITPNTTGGLSNDSFGFTFNCGDLNKTCSNGRCV